MHLRLGGIGIAVAVLAAACGDQSAQLPTRSEAPLAPEFSAKGGGGFSTTCSFPTANQLAGSYFTDNDTTKVVRSLINSMKSAGAGTDAARNLGFDVLDHVSKNVENNPDAVTGSAFVNEIIKCMFSDPNAWPASYTAATPGPEDFTVSLDFQQNGAFGVRGGSSTDPVLARDSYSGVAPPMGNSWGDILAGNPFPNRILLYGRPSTFQVGVDPYTFYNWRIVARNTTFSPAALVGLCVDPDHNAYGDQKAMVRRQDNASVSYLPYADAYFLTAGVNCTEHQLAGIVSPLGHLASGFLKLGSSLFSPRPLHATAALNPGGLAGSTGGIHTDYGPEGVVNVSLSFVVQPHDAKVCSVAADSETGCTGAETISPVTVLATYQGYAVGGVQISVVPVDNNGTPAEMRGDTTLVTGEDGTVTYTNIGVTKPGGYRLVTVAELVVDRSRNIVIQSVTSDRFNIRP